MKLFLVMVLFTTCAICNAQKIKTPKSSIVSFNFVQKKVEVSGTPMRGSITVRAVTSDQKKSISLICNRYGDVFLEIDNDNDSTKDGWYNFDSYEKCLTVKNFVENRLRSNQTLNMSFNLISRRVVEVNIPDSTKKTLQNKAAPAEDSDEMKNKNTTPTNSGSVN